MTEEISRHEVRETAPCRRELRVEVPAEQMERELAAVLGELGGSVKVPGFRPGKVPRPIVEQRFGAEARRRAVRNQIEKQFFTVCRRENFRVLGDPQFQDVGWKPGEALAFSAVFDVFPEFVPEGYRSIKLNKPSVAVTEEEIEEQIGALRERTATFAASEKEKIEEGDFGVIDFRALEPGKNGEPAGAGAKWVEGFFVEVSVRGDAPLLAGMVGMKPGETRLIEAGDDPGTEGKRLFEVKLREIKKKVLPPLDDEWAASWGAYRSLEEVRSAVKESLQTRKEVEARLELDEQALKIVLEKNRFDLPPSALAALRDLHLEVLKERVGKGYSLPEGDGSMEKTAEANARRELKTILLLREIARKEGLKADPARVAEAMAREAREKGEDPAVFRKKAEDDGSVQSYQDRVLRDQALEFIIENAEVKAADEK